ALEPCLPEEQPRRSFAIPIAESTRQVGHEEGYAGLRRQSLGEAALVGLERSLQVELNRPSGFPSLGGGTSERALHVLVQRQVVDGRRRPVYLATMRKP